MNGGDLDMVRPVPRHLLIRSSDGEGRLVPESALPSEADLHDALTDYPALIPAEDLGLSELAVVGRESGLVSGFADLVLLDRHGRLCLVEVKKESEIRRVVAQLLEYAAALWGMGLTDFEREVVQPYLRAVGAPPTLAAHLAAEFELGEEDEEGEEDVPALLAGVERALAEGDLHLIVAAPEIPVGVQRVLEYLNARGQRMFGLEVSYFGTDTPCFVPNLVVRPSLARNAVDGRSEPPATDLETLLAKAPEPAVEPVRKFLARAGESGARVEWKGYGASVRVRYGGRSRVICQLEPGRIYVTVRTPNNFPEGPFSEAHAAFGVLGLGSTSKDGWYRIVAWSDLASEQVRAVLDLALELIERLTPTLRYEDLRQPLTAEFTREDYCVWAKGVPALANKQGRAMRARRRRDDGSEADVVLEPMAGGQPGWRPHFPGSGDQERLWPAGEHSGRFVLTVRAVEAIESESGASP